MIPQILAAASLSLEGALLAAAAVFCVGVFGILSRQNVLVILMCLELMLNGANLAIVAFARAFLPANPGSTSAAQAFVVMVLAVAAAEAGVGLAILIAAYRRWRTANAGEIDLLKG